MAAIFQGYSLKTGYLFFQVQKLVYNFTCFVWILIFHSFEAYDTLVFENWSTRTEIIANWRYAKNAKDCKLPF